MSDTPPNNQPYVLTLAEPITVGEKQITALTIRKPHAKQWRNFPLGGGATIGHMLDMLSDLADIPPSTVDKLGGEDMNKALEVLGNFMQNSRAT